MMKHLRGILWSLENTGCVIDVGGVGYMVLCSQRTRDALPSKGEEVFILIEMIVREDAMILYGFSTTHERDLFRLLTTVQGVGAKVALSLLSLGNPEQIEQAIAQGDKAFISQADGVGPRLAARILTELKDKVQHFSVSTSQGLPLKSSNPMAQEDSILALMGLGYKPHEIRPVIAYLIKESPELSTSELIKEALPRLSRTL